MPAAVLPAAIMPAAIKPAEIMLLFYMPVDRIRHMESRLPKKFILIPVIYVGIIILFLFLQFWGGKKISERFGIIQISGSYMAGNGNRRDKVGSLDVSWDDFHLIFNHTSTLDIEFSDGSRKTVPPSTFSLMPESMEIAFANFAVLRLSYADSTSRIIDISFDTSASPLPVKQISVPYLGTGGLNPVSETSLPVVTLKNADMTAYISMPRGSVLAPERQRLVIPADDKGASLRYTAAEDNTAGGPALSWFLSKMKPVPEEEIQAQIGAFLDAAYEGWKNSRYSVQEGIWKMKNGPAAFSEAALSALLAESQERNQYDEIFNRLWAVPNLNRQTLTFQTTPYFGNLFALADIQQQEDAVLINEFTDRIRARDVSVLAYPHLLKVIADRGPFGLTQDLFSFILSMQAQDFTPAVIAGIGTVYLDAVELGLDTEDLYTFVVKGIEDFIYPFVGSDGRSVFISDDTKSVDLFTNLEIALLLRNLDKHSDKPLFSLLGGNILSSVLKTGDALGYIPESISGQKDKSGETGTYMAPEDIYSILTEGRYYPRETSLIKSFGPGTWAWSAAEISASRIGESTLTLEITYPPGRIHNLIIQGIKPFQNLSMLGQPWREDRYFQDYASGWFYREDTRTLFIKLRNKTEKEEIVLSY
ncbi:MAG: hypothetical protein E4H36_04265 [Spirochaetales bacterium]|nr:MAG: hypothetical protein E4H36_04265 [Spirochaetales bacterium]